jgi:tetratricopeptide (TPR) repeat protein
MNLLFTTFVFLLLPVFCFSQLKMSPMETAQDYFEKGDWKKALSSYEKIINQAETYKNDPLLWYKKGYCLQQLKQYDKALSCYTKAEELKPSFPSSQASLFSAMAKVYALKNDVSLSLWYLNKELSTGYFNYSRMDTASEFAVFNNDTSFNSFKKEAYAIAFPCMLNPKAREFDFWVGEWNAYETDTHILRGHSIIQVSSGGCMILENWTSLVTDYTGKSMNFIDNVTGLWQQVWVGSEGSGQTVYYNGRYFENAMHFEYDPPLTNDKKLKGRFTFFNLGPDIVRQLQETSADDGKTWIPVYDFIYERVKAGDNKKDHFRKPKAF